MSKPNEEKYREVHTAQMQKEMDDRWDDALIRGVEKGGKMLRDGKERERKEREEKENS